VPTIVDVARSSCFGSWLAAAECVSTRTLSFTALWIEVVRFFFMRRALSRDIDINYSS